MLYAWRKKTDNNNIKKKQVKNQKRKRKTLIIRRVIIVSWQVERVRYLAVLYVREMVIAVDGHSERTTAANCHYAPAAASTAGKLRLRQLAAHRRRALVRISSATWWSITTTTTHGWSIGSRWRIRRRNRQFTWNKHRITIITIKHGYKIIISSRSTGLG